jgi:hypothetical protein
MTKSKVAAIDAEVATLLRRIEILAEEGAVDEASVLNEKMENLKKERHTLLQVIIPFFISTSTSDADFLIVDKRICVKLVYGAESGGVRCVRMHHHSSRGE